MRNCIVSLLLCCIMIAMPVASGCAWLHSGTPTATATAGAIDCVEVSATDAFKQAFPQVLELVIKYALGGPWTWGDLVAAFGGIEGLIKDGVAAVTCSLSVIATVLEAGATGASQPAVTPAVKIAGRTLTPAQAAQAARLARAYLDVKHRAIKRPAVVRP